MKIQMHSKALQPDMCEIITLIGSCIAKLSHSQAQAVFLYIIQASSG